MPIGVVSESKVYGDEEPAAEGEEVGTAVRVRIRVTVTVLGTSTVTITATVMVI